MIQKNKKAVSSMKEVIRTVQKKNIELCRLNIPKILIDIPQLVHGSKAPKMKLSNFTRYDIHQIYTIYKTLHEVTSQRYGLDYKIDNGLDYPVYRNGLYQVNKMLAFQTYPHN